MSNRPPIKQDNGGLPKWESSLTEEQEQANAMNALISQFNAVMANRDKVLTPREVLETLRKVGAGASEELIERASQRITSQNARELIADATADDSQE